MTGDHTHLASKELAQHQGHWSLPVIELRPPAGQATTVSKEDKFFLYFDFIYFCVTMHKIYVSTIFPFSNM